MEWFKLAANYADDPKIVAAGEEAEVLFVRALAYCADAETGGFLPSKLVARLTPTKTKKRVESLVQNGLWLEVPGGYRVRSWMNWQSELETLAQRRRSDRDRKRAQREREAAARAAAEEQVSRDASRDSHADPSRDIGNPSRDCHSDVTPGEGEGEKPTNQNDSRPPDFAVPGPRLGGGDGGFKTGPANITHAAEAVALLASLEPARLRPGRRTAEALAPDVAQLLALGWPATELQARMSENAPQPIHSLGGFLRSRLPEPTRYTQSAVIETGSAPLPDWCGKCEEPSRLIDTGNGFQRCPDCSPLAQAGKDPR